MSTVLPPVALTAALMAASHAAAGLTLGLFFGALAVITLLSPPLVLAETNWRCRALAGGAILAAVGLYLLVPVMHGVVGFRGWFACLVVLAAYAAALAGLSMTLERAGLHPILAGATVIVAALLWLAWPVWLAPWLTGPHRESLVAWLVPVHPPLVLNGVLLPWLPVPWTQHPLAYVLTNLGDDIPYRMPAGALPGFAFYTSISLITWTIALVPRPDRWPEGPHGD